jgi:hypothetical protein
MGRTVRAIVVDASASVSARQAAEAADAEARTATIHRRFDSARPGPALRRASDWLASASPGLREIVVISDFQRGALTANDVADVPAGIGFRSVRVERSGPAAHVFDAPPVIFEGRALSREVAVEGDSTAVSLRDLGEAEGPRIDAAGDAAGRIRSSVAIAGAIAPAREEPIAVRFGSATGEPALEPLPAEWMRGVVFRLLGSPAATAPIRPSSEGGVLTLEIETDPASLAAARLAQAALNAREDPRAWAEQEPRHLPSIVLDAWTRPAAVPSAEAWRRGTDSDGRWMWAAALVLMLVESGLRRTRSVRSAPSEAHAA